MIFLHQIAGSLPHSQTRVTGAAATADRARRGEGERQTDKHADITIYPYFFVCHKICECG